MEKAIKIILIIISMISIYIIFCIGLGYFWTIGYSYKADKINSVLINLAYSYVAGFLFYILISYLPYKLRESKLRPVVKYKINELYNQIQFCVQTFETKNIENEFKTLKIGQLKNIISSSDMYINSFYANNVGYQMNNFQFLVLTKEKSFNPHCARIKIFKKKSFFFSQI